MRTESNDKECFSWMNVVFSSKAKYRKTYTQKRTQQKLNYIMAQHNSALIGKLDTVL